MTTTNDAPLPSECEWCGSPLAEVGALSTHTMHFESKDHTMMICEQDRFAFAEAGMLIN